MINGLGHRASSVLLWLTPALPVLLAGLLCRGESFPSNDDFLYARSVQLLVEEGKWERVSLHGLLSPAAVTHTLWGALFCWPFGFQFAALSWSSLMLASLAAMALRAMARSVGLDEPRAQLVGLSLACDPLFLTQSFNFMTDAPSASWACIALSATTIGLRVGGSESTEGRSRGRWWLLLGSLATAIGSLNRQNVLVTSFLPMVVLFDRWRRRRPVWVDALLALIPAAAAGLALGAGLYETGSTQRSFPGMVRAIDRDWLRRFLIDMYGGCLLMGLCLLPLLFALMKAWWARRRAILATATLAAGLAATLTVFAKTRGEAYLTQSTGYCLQNAHVGPILLSDGYDPGRWGDMGGVQWPVWSWQVLSIASMAAISLYLVVLVRGEPATIDRESQVIEHGISAAAALPLAALALAIDVRFDRYWLMLAPSVLALAACRLAPTRRLRWPGLILSFGMAMGLFALSAVFAHDYQAWQRARWSIVRQWRAEGLPPQHIDGGYEVNGWFRSAEDHRTTPRPGDQPFGWWSGEAKRFIAVGPRDGMREIARATWRSWATGREHAVLGLEREPDRQLAPGMR